MAKTSNHSGEEGDHLPDGAMIGLTGAAGMTGTPLEVVRGCITDAVDWLKKEPEDDFAPGELEQFVRIGTDLSTARDVDSALDRLRKLHRAQEKRRRAGLVRKFAALVRRRKKATIVSGVLSMLLNQRATERATQGFRKLEEESTVLKHRVEALGPPTLEGLVEHLKGAMLLERRIPDVIGNRFLLHGSQFHCDVCGGPATGEMRAPGSRSVKVCQAHSVAAQQVIDQRRALGRTYQNLLKDLRKILESCRPDLTESLQLDPQNAPAIQNLKTVDANLAEIAKALA